MRQVREYGILCVDTYRGLTLNENPLKSQAMADLSERLDAYAAAVRAERDAAWREGVDKGTVAEGGHLPECAKETQGARYCDCGAWGARHAHNAALAALAARMEAK